MRRLLSLSIVSLGLASGSAIAQTAIQPGSIVGTFNAIEYVPAQSAQSLLTIYTVPGDRNARVTDIVASSYSDVVCYVQVQFGATYFYFSVPPRSVQSFHMQTGYGMTPGTNLVLAPGSCPAFAVLIQFRGFHFTIP
jgi:hypothetical protein